MHIGHAPRTGAAKKIQERGFDQIIGMMGEKYSGAAAAASDLDKKGKARETSRGFNRQLRSLGQSADVSRPNLAVELEVSRDLLDKARVPPRFSAAQLMIQMADDQFVVAQVDQEMQQRDGIAAAGNADKVAMGWREIAKQIVGTQLARYVVAASPGKRPTPNAQRPTLNPDVGERRMPARLGRGSLARLLLDVLLERSLRQRLAALQVSPSAPGSACATAHTCAPQKK